MPNDRSIAALEPLWRIEDELEALLNSVDTCPDELLPELEQRIELYLAQEIEKVDRLAAVLTQFEHVEANAKSEIDRLRARAASRTAPPNAWSVTSSRSSGAAMAGHSRATTSHLASVAVNRS